MDGNKEWILLSALGIVATILAFVMKTITNQVLKKLDEMVDELKSMGKDLAVLQRDNATLHEANNTINHRLNNHADRLREIEMGKFKIQSEPIK